MKMILMLLSFFLVSVKSWSQIVCSDDTRNHTLSFFDIKSNLWDFSQISFYHPKYLASYLSCSKFLESLDDDFRSTTLQSHLQPLYPLDARNLRIKYSSPLNQKLLDKCSMTSGCKVAFFQNIFNPIYAYTSLRKKDVFDKYPYCLRRAELTGSPFQLTQKKKSNIPVIQNSLGPMDVWRLPQDSIFNKMMNYLDQNKPRLSVISTMIPSLSILQKFDQWLIDNPQSEIYFLFSYNLASLQDNFPIQFNFSSGRLHILPVFQTPLNPDSYHIKGGFFISASKSEVLLHSVNLRRFREEKVADLAFVSADANVIDSYAAILNSVLKFQCENKKWLSCSQELRYFENDQRRLKIDSFVQTTCDHYKSRLSQELSRFKMPALPVLQPGSAHLMNELIQLVRSARKEIVISSHVYGHSLFDRELNAALLRGVKVKMLIGSSVKKKELKNYLIKNYKAKIINTNLEYTSHAKFIIIDDDIVVWGSGNLTKTSLNNPMDLFLLTKDSALKKELSVYFYSYFKK